MGYVYFMNVENRSRLLYINSDQVQYKALNSLIADNFLLYHIGLNHQAATTWFILYRILDQHFASAMRKQKYIITIKVIPKFSN